MLDMICGKTVRVEQEDKISHQQIPTRAQLFVQRGNRRSGICRQIMNILFFTSGDRWRKALPGRRRLGRRPLRSAECAQLEFNVIMDKDLVETTARSGDFLENWDVGG